MHLIGIASSAITTWYVCRLMTGWGYIPSAADVHHLAVLALSVWGIATTGYTFAYHFFHVVVGRDILIRALQVSTLTCLSLLVPFSSCLIPPLLHLTRSLCAQSVTMNASTLLWVAALIAIIIYIYSLAAFAWLRRDFSADHNLLFCDSAWEVSCGFVVRYLGDCFCIP